MENFVAPEDEVDYAKGEHDDILSLATWSKYLNPLQWFKGGKPGWVEGVVMAVLLLVILFVVGILVKLMKMFNCIFKCLTCCRFFRGKSRENYDKVRVRAGSVGKYRRQASEKVKSVIPIKRSNSRPYVNRDVSINDDNLHFIVVNDNTDDYDEAEPQPESQRGVRFTDDASYVGKKFAF